MVPKERINGQITSSNVRLIGADGRQVGVVSIREALRRAEEQDLDLVEISPNVDPPVCRITDFSKYYFQKEKKAKEARKKQHEVEVKEIKYGPNTEDHDYGFKKNNAIKFLQAAQRVKFTVLPGTSDGSKEIQPVGTHQSRSCAHRGRRAEPVSDRNLLFLVMSPQKEMTSPGRGKPLQ